MSCTQRINHISPFTSCLCLKWWMWRLYRRPPQSPMSCCRSQPLCGGGGAEEEWCPLLTAARSRLSFVTQQEAAEQGNGGWGHTATADLPSKPEAQTVPSGGGRGRAVQRWETGEEGYTAQHTVVLSESRIKFWFEDMNLEAQLSVSTYRSRVASSPGYEIICERVSKQRTLLMQTNINQLKHKGCRRKEKCDLLIQ